MNKKCWIGRLCYFWDYGKKYKKHIGVLIDYHDCTYEYKRGYKDLITDEYWQFCIPLRMEELVNILKIMKGN